MIDYRSDTFTKPSQAMLKSMLSAEVGDDVFGEDPTVNKLQTFASAMFGMEDALFCPSGTMTNQIAIKCHTQPGDEVICEQFSHVYAYEGGGIAFNSSCSVKPLAGAFGKLSSKQVQQAINPDDIHKPVTKLVTLENTSNRGGGSCYDFAEIENMRKVCLQNQLALHLDGARLFNALVAKNETPQQYGKVFDSVSICLSKSLGAPVGSLLLGKKDLIKKAKRLRKVLGGGMRQAGYLASAGLYALQNNVERLSEDHTHTRMLAEALSEKEFITNIFPPETNILIFEVSGKYSPQSFTAKLEEDKILVIPISPTQVRMVVHLDVTKNMIEKTLKTIRQL